jgi:hypothetical protein
VVEAWLGAEPKGARHQMAMVAKESLLSQSVVAQPPKHFGGSTSDPSIVKRKREWVDLVVTTGERLEYTALAKRRRAFPQRRTWIGPTFQLHKRMLVAACFIHIESYNRGKTKWNEQHPIFDVRVCPMVPDRWAQ